jgi:multiple sugar transport system permease protein
LNIALSYFGVAPIDWLGNPSIAMPAIVILAVWKNFGYNMLIFIAGLQNIPEDLYEAAHIDGAGGWRQFVDITIPMLAPTTVFVVMITVIGYFQLFAEPYIMTEGGPMNATMSVVLMMYEQGFRWWNMGFAAAIAFVLFAVISIFSIVQLIIQRRLQQ